MIDNYFLLIIVFYFQVSVQRKQRSFEVLQQWYVVNKSNLSKNEKTEFLSEGCLLPFVLLYYGIWQIIADTFFVRKPITIWQVCKEIKFSFSRLFVDTFMDLKFVTHQVKMGQLDETRLTQMTVKSQWLYNAVFNDPKLNKFMTIKYRICSCKCQYYRLVTSIMNWFFDYATQLENLLKKVLHFRDVSDVWCHFLSFSAGYTFIVSDKKDETWSSVCFGLFVPWGNDSSVVGTCRPIHSQN